MKKCGIIVLGNGFDLFHGHKTSYKDFIDGVKNDYTTNLWINYFSSLIKIDGWVDIENEFFKILNNMSTFKNKYTLYNYKQPIEIEYLNLFRFLGFTPNYYIERGYEEIPTGIDTRTLRNKTDTIYDQIIINKSKYSFINTRGILNYSKIDSKIIADFKEVKTLLKQYIKTSVDSKDLYKTTNSIYPCINDFDEIVVINFNYTDTISFYNKNTNNIFVHGDVDNEIIFGHNHIEHVEYSMFNKLVQQQSFGINYKYEFMKAIDKPEVNSCDEYQLIILGHSFDENDHEVISWIYKYLYSHSKHISRFKYFFYDDGTHDDLISRNLNIRKFFTQSIGTISNIQTSKQSSELLRRLMFEDPSNYCFTGQHEFDYFERSNNIFKIELK